MDISNEQLFVNVAIPVPLDTLFQYSLSGVEQEKAKVGCRVLVPFGNKKLVGIIIERSNVTTTELTKIKDILSICDNEPILSFETLVLAKWLSNFYLYPIGEVLSCMLPNLFLKLKDTVSNETRVYTTKIAPKVRVVLCKRELEAAKQHLKRSKKQQQLFNFLSAKLDVDEPVWLDQLKQQFSTVIINALIKKELAELHESPVQFNAWVQNLKVSSKKRPNAEQSIAIASINQRNRFGVTLLEGVTGSGKTEVYLQVIEEVLLAKKTVLILVPEIGLTPQTVSRFEERFGKVVTVWHSGLNDTQRLEVFKQAIYGQMGIFIGTRSAVFLPITHLGMVIVDEEHDESFKQQDSLRYHARDVAIYRAKQLDIPLILGSATPSLESLHHALNKKYYHLMLKNRAGKASMPTQHLLDLRGVKLQAGIAPALLARMEFQLKRGNQVLIFVNRRGYAPALICNNCGHVESCNHCDHPFTVHASSNNLQCHRCGKYSHIRPRCSECGSQNITTKGIGTEQIQDFCNSNFPDYSTIRIDSDSVKGKNKLTSILSEINSNQHQILIGTQILSKGHHFPKVTLAIILNVDSFLFSSDYRAPEKLAQLVTQIGGRAGRENSKGEVWLQSYQVSNFLLQDLINNGYSDFSRTLLQERIAANLPPNVFQAALRVEHEAHHIIIEFMQFANSLLLQFKQLNLVGPFPAGIEKKQNRYRFITVVTGNSMGYLNEALRQVKSELKNRQLSAQIRWSIDVMPTDFS